MIFHRMQEADGVIFASPVYSLQVTAILKNLLDRLAFVFHRPCFFHHVFMPVATQGVYGDKKMVSYLEETADLWGFEVCSGLRLTVDPHARDFAEKEKEAIRLAAKRFADKLQGRRRPVPGFKKMLIFRMVRTFQKYNDPKMRDHNYFQEKGWFESPYFYDVPLDPLKRLVGFWAEKQAEKQNIKMKTEK